MKHLKRFEDIDEDSLTIDDYVVCSETIDPDYNDDDVIEFINNNVGQFIRFKNEKNVHDRHPYCIKYDNVPEDITEYFVGGIIRYMSKEEIIYHSKNREDAEVFLNANKYNL